MSEGQVGFHVSFGASHALIGLILTELRRFSRRVQPIGHKHRRCAAKKASASAVFATERLDAAAGSGAADATGPLSCMLVVTGTGGGRAGTLGCAGRRVELTV